MDPCSSAGTGAGFTGTMVRFIDCQTQTLGSASYQTLSAPGSTLSIVLTGFLTILIALIGYDLLLGRSFTVRNGVLFAVKIGFVFALATSWPAYSTLVYGLVTDGPAQIVSDIGRPAGVPGSDGTLLHRLDLADAALATLAIEGVGIGVRDDIPPPPFAGFNAFALGGSRILFLLTAIAGLGSVKVIAGLLLALGPFFIAFLMFESTRSLFEGWVRVLAGSAIATIGVSVALGLELELLEPWLTGALARRAAGESLPSLPTELLVISCVFTLVVLAVLASCLWLTRAFRLPPITVRTEASLPSVHPHDISSAAARSSDARVEERSRAQAVADVLVALQQREGGGRGSAAGVRIHAPGGPGGLDPARQMHLPIGRSFRRAMPRESASSGKRDLR